MKNNIRVLILTAPFGNGHLSVAREIQREFKRHKNVDVIMYDLYTEEYRRLTKFARKYHLRQYKKGFSQLSYKYIYYNSGRLLKTKLGHMYKRFGMKQLIRKIIEVKPDLILNTFPVNSSYYLKDEGIDLPVFTMITDYYANANWIHPNIACHFVASDNVVKQLLNQGIPEERILLTGIPVRSPFQKRVTDEKIETLRNKFQIHPGHKVVLAVAGAKGVLPNFKRLAKRLSEIPNLTLLLVCGKQKKLYRKLTRTFAKQSNVKVFPFVTDIENLMAVSDLMVTKPGGITITECAQMGLPLVLYKPIYGQELENAKYFSKKDAAIVTYKENEVIEAVYTLIQDDSKLSLMKESISKIAQHDSANRIVMRMLAELGDVNENQKNYKTSF